MKLQDIIEAAPLFAKETFGKWFITAAMNPNFHGKFEAIAKDKNNPNIFHKVEADSTSAAIALVKEKISKPDYATADNILVAINFNVVFTTDILSRYDEPYWFTLERDGENLYLVLAGENYKNELEIIKEFGFRPAAHRLSTDITDAGATQAWAVAIPGAVSRSLKLYVNGRYTIGEPITDSEGNEKFPLTFDSLTVNPLDKKRLREPALTVVPRK